MSEFTTAAKAVPMSGKDLLAQAHEADRVARALRKQAEQTLAAEAEARRPRQPEVADGLPEFVMFSRYQSGRAHTYAAIGWREGHHVRWAVTGSETRRFNWRGLLAFIGEANWSTLHQFTDTTSLLPAGAEPPVAETMGEYGRVVSSAVLGDSMPGY